MALLDRLKQELDRAGKVAQDAFDDGKTRLEAFRTRQLADKAAQALGYAVYRAKKSGRDLDAATYDRLAATLETHDSEAARLEADIELKRQQATASRASSSTTTSGSDTTSSDAYPNSPS
jgi:ADP-ribosylglycohydrolase